MSCLPPDLFSRARRLMVIASGTFFLLGIHATQAQRPTTTVPQSGIRDRAPKLFALANATIIPQAGRKIDSGTLVIENGAILAVGENVHVPNHAEILDMRGKVIYPGLIDAYCESAAGQHSAGAAHWNKYVRPERDISTDWERDAAEDTKFREAGFALRLLVPDSGIIKGTSAVVTTSDAPPSESIVARQTAQHLRLSSPRGASRSYFPNSPMGAVALARQTFYDASWYDEAQRAFRLHPGVPRPESNLALETISEAIRRDSLFIFEAPDEQYALRANRFAVEFGLNRVAIRGSGREYQRLDAIANTGRTLILPVNFPDPPNVATPEATRDASLSELMHWYLAPENPARLRAANVNLVVTTHGLQNKQDFRKQLSKAVERGLSPGDALAAVTTAPAELLGIDHQAGSLEVGKSAHLMITDGPWLDENSKVLETWVDGKRFEHHRKPTHRLIGTWKLTLESDQHERQVLFLIVEEKDDKLSGSASIHEPKSDTADGDHENDASEEAGDDADPGDPGGEEGEADEDDREGERKTKVDLKHIDTAFGRIAAQFSAELWKAKGTVRLSATLVAGDSPTLIGRLLDESGKLTRFTGSAWKPTQAELEASDHEGEAAEETKQEQSRSEEEEEEEEEEGKTDRDDPGQGRRERAASDPSTTVKLDIRVNYPLGADGVLQSDRDAGTVVFQHATVWTCGPKGIIEDGSILIQDGRIVAVGQDLAIPKDALRVNARGKHITPGIIDCHSHMATDGGINEATQAITAEVRIGDFIDATDISIHRQLAGGVTTANILHGSANPIGGQNQVIKLRWGKLPEEMKFAEAPPGIKFALGENVKQSNWGEAFRTRYPQSRMGVEQIIRDAFLAAREYKKQRDQWSTDRKGLPPRRDLELDALLEVLDGQRWVHCHSYRQDEILALIRTLDSFGITIGTFQHILEGYKVAKEMVEHGAMGSAFSDWWGYKFEVFDAIPYNGALMHDAGIIVSFNSDDAELARHLNHEAAKAVKYGGVPREEALRFVTLNPARQLRIDEYVGSLETGKHADLVVWSGDPLQITSRCEQTWIDGVRYFDIEEEKESREKQANIRQQLIQRILDSGEKMKKPGEHEQLWRDLFPRHDEYCGHGHGH